MTTILILLGLLLINAVFAMSEIAIVSSRKIRLEQAAERGDAGAAAALALAAEPTRFLSTIQVGITLVGILAGAYGERAMASDVAGVLRHIPVVAPAADVLALVIVVLIITYFSLVIGELVPKRLAMSHSEAIARSVAGPMTVLAKVGRPLVALLSFSTDLILKLMRVRPRADEDVSEDEVRAMIDKGTESGVFHQAERELLERVLRLDDLSVGALMVPRSEIVWIDESAKVERVRITVATSPYSHFPVCRGGLDRLVGVVHVKDLVKHGLVAGSEFDIKEIARPPLYVPEGMQVLRLLDLFRAQRTHVGFVVDEYGGTEGLITLSDVLAAAVGDFPRLGAEEPASAVLREDGSWLVDGQLGIEEFARMMELSPHDLDMPVDVNTVAGLVLAALGHLPRTGERVERWGLSFEVVDMDRQRVDKILVARNVPEPPSA